MTLGKTESTATNAPLELKQMKGKALLELVQTESSYSANILESLEHATLSELWTIERFFRKCRDNRNKA